MSAMRTTIVAVVLPLAVLAVVPAGRAVASPPEGVSGRMVLDEVVDGLRRYDAARTEAARVAWLRALKQTRDPRVAVVLGESLREASPEVRGAAAEMLALYFIPLRRAESNSDYLVYAIGWWTQNKADLRRRAKQLPR
jgi:hypothetical protein